jgi:hypothetical protein
VNVSGGKQSNDQRHQKQRPGASVKGMTLL